MTTTSLTRKRRVTSDCVSPPATIAPNAHSARQSGLGLAEWVYRTLRTQIIDATRPAGAELRERDLAEELSVSRVPVREALPRLEAGGFVRIEARRPAVITHISFADVDELYDLRAPIEATVSALAARRVAAGSDPRPLMDFASAADTSLDADDHTHFMEANVSIHSAIVALAGNPLLTQVMAPLVDRTDRLNQVSQYCDRTHRHDEHSALVHAIISGRPELASAASFVHIEGERSRAINALPEHPHFLGR